MKIATIFGARPQFIKASVVSRAIEAIPGQREVVVHTGQHFDTNMSDVFYRTRAARTRLLSEHSLGAHGAMTGRMLEAVEQVLLKKNQIRL